MGCFRIFPAPILGVVLLLVNISSGNPALRKTIGGLVVGGTPVQRGEYPWLVFVYADGSGCGGTILNEQWILTAGHCAESAAESYTIIAGAYNVPNWDGTEQMASVDTVIVHQSYNPQSLQNDIALLHLTAPLTFNSNVKKATISTKSTQLETFLTVVGWGRTIEGGQASPIPLKATISRREDSVCQRAYYYYDPSTRICAGDTGKGSCQGDSGGPLHNPKDKTVVGVVSGGGQCAYEGQPGYYTNIAIYIDWITTNMGGI